MKIIPSNQGAFTVSIYRALKPQNRLKRIGANLAL